MKSNRIADLKSIHFSSVLHQFYVSSFKEERLKRLSYSLFTLLKTEKLDVEKQAYWNSIFPLFHSLLILHKNKFIETDLSNVLLEYDTSIYSLLVKNRCIDFDFLPFYTKILLNRTDSAKEMNSFYIALIQCAEKIIQYFVQLKYELHKERYHYSILTLIDIYTLNLYKEAILPIFKTFVKAIEESILKENQSGEIIYYNNTSVYPLLCEVLNHKQQFDWSSQANELLAISLKCIDMDYFYFINTLRAFANKQIDKGTLTSISSQLKYLKKRLKTEELNSDLSHANDFLQLSLASLKSAELSSWDEILLVPRY